MAAILAFSNAVSAQQAHPEQELIDTLVLTSRMMARSEIAFFDDALGHISVRSQINPDRYYIARAIAGGLVSTSDIIEYDLDSNPVGGPRSDGFQEVYIHGEIYKARPDIQVVAHAHPPEAIAFSVSSVPLLDGEQPVPVWDIRPLNNGRGGIVNTPELGRSMAEALGDNDSVLLLGHGVVVTSTTLNGMIGASSGIRSAAQQQQMLIGLDYFGGTWDPNPRRVTVPQPQSAATERRPPVVPPASDYSPGGPGGGERGWDLLKYYVLSENGGDVPKTTPPAPARPSDPEDALRQDLAWASQMLASDELGILDFAGHISVRSPSNPDRYWISHWAAPGHATPELIVEADLDSNPLSGGIGENRRLYREAFLHGEIYKARPDVMAVVHSHTPEITAFAHTSVPMRVVTNGGSFIGDGLPIFNIREYHDTATIIESPAIGQAMAEVMGDSPGVLLTGHGVVLTDSSLYGLVNRIYGLRMNAMVQLQAMALGGEISYLEGEEATAGTSVPVVPTGNGGGRDGAARAWEYWLRTVQLHE
ncbi:MAG: class II aldolase/adducin family protein [Pseudomonadota bacterium]